MFFPESFIEVSEEEFKREDEDEDQLVMISNEGSPDNIPEDGTKEEEKTETSLPEASSALKLKEEEDKMRQTKEKELKEVTETESSSAPAINEWEHFDVVSMVDGSFFEGHEMLCFRLSLMGTTQA